MLWLRSRSQLLLCLLNLVVPKAVAVEVRKRHRYLDHIVRYALLLEPIPIVQHVKRADSPAPIETRFPKDLPEVQPTAFAVTSMIEEQSEDPLLSSGSRTASDDYLTTEKYNTEHGSRNETGSQKHCNHAECGANKQSTKRHIYLLTEVKAS
jgi:hypothetical protein